MICVGLGFVPLAGDFTKNSTAMLESIASCLLVAGMADTQFTSNSTLHAEVMKVFPDIREDRKTHKKGPHYSDVLVKEGCVRNEFAKEMPQLFNLKVGRVKPKNVETNLEEDSSTAVLKCNYESD